MVIMESSASPKIFGCPYFTTPFPSPPLPILCCMSLTGSIRTFLLSFSQIRTFIQSIPRSLPCHDGTRYSFFKLLLNHQSAIRYAATSSQVRRLALCVLLEYWSVFSHREAC